MSEGSDWRGFAVDGCHTGHSGANGHDRQSDTSAVRQAIVVAIRRTVC